MKRIEAKIKAHQLELALNADVIDLATVKPVPRFNVGDTVYIPCLFGLDEIEKVTPRKIKKIEVTKSNIDGKYHVHYDDLWHTTGSDGAEPHQIERVSSKEVVYDT